MLSRQDRQTRPLRFALSTLFLAVTIVALACVGLLRHTRLWADGILSLTVFAYSVVGIRAFTVAGHKRAAALAFTVIGAAYVVLIVSNVLPVLRDSLFSNDILEAVYSVVPKSPKELNPRFAETYPWHHLGWLFHDDMLGEPRRHFVLIGIVFFRGCSPCSPAGSLASCIPSINQDSGPGRHVAFASRSDKIASIAEGGRRLSDRRRTGILGR